jgi:phenylacetaldehyde dehydrogenase
MSESKILPAVSAFLTRGHSHFIDGAYLGGKSAQFIDVINSDNGTTLATVQEASTAEIAQAIASARRTFKGAWAAVSPAQRAVLINRFADLIETHGEELAQLESLCSGKSIQLERMLEIGFSATSLRHYAGSATRINGETITPSFPALMGEQYTAFTRREPLGVVAGIVPWNFSLMIGLWKIGAALATGCTIVLKPSPFTPLSLLRVAELALEAGIPAGVINVLNGGGQTGQTLIAHPDIAKVSFTGSVPTGIEVGKAAMSANLTRVTLELGGKNAAALLADVDIDGAVSGIIQTTYVHQGQVCAAPERLYVHRSIVEPFTRKLATALQQLKIGSPLDETAQFGPLANAVHLDKVMRYFNHAAEHNKVICGGKRIERPGYYVEPTVVLANGPQDPLLCEEIFGPILTILPFDTDAELVAHMNDNPYGLTASVWTNDLSRALRLIPQIEAGTVYLNMHTFLDPAVPFGGVKSSGIGREFGSAFIDDYTELKSVIVRY